jgi:hypothetical protein
MRPSRAHLYSRNSAILPSPGKDFDEDTATIFPAVAVSMVGPKRENARASRAGRILLDIATPPRLWKEGEGRGIVTRAASDGEKRNAPVCGRWAFFRVGYQGGLMRCVLIQSSSGGPPPLWGSG